MPTMESTQVQVQNNFSKVTHCIFDMDGLLLDTEDLYTKAIQKILDPYDKIYTWEVKQSIMGFHINEVAKKLVKYYYLPITWQEYAELQKKYTSEIMGDAQLMPGVKRLLQHLHANKIPFCLATSSGEDMVEIKTMRHRELFDLFNHKVCGATDAEVKQGKPAPDIFLVAALRFPDKPKPENCLVFEDATNGVKAARTAGMQCVMVPDPRVPKELRQEASLVLNSLEEFKPELFGLPSFTD